MSSTIFALSTPLGRSGLCIFRISGPKAIEISNNLCNKDLAKTPRMMQKVSINWNKQLIDSGLGTCFIGPHSATGEDIVEFNLHGSLAVIDSMNKVLRSFSSLGVREAERGEFSKRALLNGKMSLTEVEGLSDLLEAETQLQLTVSQLNLNGKIDKSVKKWRAALVDLIAQLEAKIEFDESESLGLESNFDSVLNVLVKELEDVVTDSAVYERVKNGFQVLIFGPPNIGKSSLMNFLAKRHVSIVTEQEGTTRDLVHFDAHLNGLPIRLIDSAGIRETSCKIEAMGVELAKKAAEEADIIVLLTDGFASEPFIRYLEHNNIDSKKLIPVISKSDLISVRKNISVLGQNAIYISSVSGEGIDILSSRITDLALNRRDISSLSAKLLLNERQSSCLRECLHYVNKSIGESEYILKVEYLKHSVKELKKISGEYFNIEEIYDKVFANFCIGK